MADKMAKFYMCLLRLIILGSFLKGTSGVNETHVFSSSGGTVSLPCNNAVSDCTSTTWNYNKYIGSKTDELVAGGEIKNNTETRERLSLGSDCSLNIKKVTKEDYGSYSCQQYENGQQQGTDERVYLHVLHVSSSSSQTDIRLGSSLTLYCQLQSYNQFPCETLVRTEGLQLIWVNQAGVSVMTDSRYLISSRDCITTLTTKLPNEDQNRGWRCQVTLRNQLKTSDTFTVKYSDQDDPTTPVTNSEDHSTTNKPTSHEREIVISTVAAALAVILVAAFWLIYKKRRDDKKRTHSSVVKDVNEHKATYETINVSIPSMPNVKEETDDVTYSEVTSSNKKQVQMNNDHSNDTVTYAAIRTTPPNDEHYTSVEKEKKNTPHK